MSVGRREGGRKEGGGGSVEEVEMGGREGFCNSIFIVKGWDGMVRWYLSQGSPLFFLAKRVRHRQQCTSDTGQRQPRFGGYTWRLREEALHRGDPETQSPSSDRRCRHRILFTGPLAPRAGVVSSSQAWETAVGWYAFPALKRLSSASSMSKRFDAECQKNEHLLLGSRKRLG